MRPCVACNSTGVASKGGPCAACQWYSPTQIKEYMLCERKWWLHYVHGVPQPMSEAAALGDRVHKVLETYYLRGEIDGGARELELAAMALPFLPPRSQFTHPELKLLTPTPSRQWWYQARGDLLDFDALVVHDYKTSKNPRKYGLDEIALPRDVQGVLLGAGAMTYMNCDSVTLQWTYIPTANRGQAYPVRAKVTRDELEPRLVRIDQTVAKLRAARAIANQEETQPNAKACGMFGGCPYAAEACSYPKRNPLAMLLGQGRDQATTAKQESESDTMGTIDPNVLARIKRLAQSSDASEATPEEAEEAMVQAEQEAQAEAAEASDDDDDDEEAKLAAALAEAKAKKAAKAKAEAAAKAAKEAAAKEAAARTEGLSKGADADKKAFDEAVAKAKANGKGPRGKYTLYIGCMPVGPDASEYHMADMLIRGAAQSAAQANGVKHYKEIEYGKGHAALVFALESVLAGYSVDIVVLPGRESDDALHTLRAYAARIVQSV